MFFISVLYSSLSPSHLISKKWFRGRVEINKKNKLLVYNNKSIHVYIKFFGYNFFLFREWVKKNRFITQWCNIAVRTSNTAHNTTR